MGSRHVLNIKTDSDIEIIVRSAKASARRELFSPQFAHKGNNIQIRGASIVSTRLFEEDATTPNDPSQLTIKGCPIFFDQTEYMFEIIFPQNVDEARLFSPVERWCAACDWNPDTKRMYLPVNFANDLGDFELIFEWRKDSDETWHSVALRSCVFSTKLDIGSHVPLMIEEVQNRFNWLQLDLFRSTTWNWDHDEQRDGTLQTWLLIFQHVHEELSQCFTDITQQHRKKLTPISYRVPADRIRRATARQEEHIAEKLEEFDNPRFLVKRKRLDSDTPENRYIKHLLLSCIRTLVDLNERLAPIERVSSVFKERLQEWEQEWARASHHPFWRCVGPFRGLHKESLILSQDPLYARIRRNWIYLQQGVSLLDRDLRGGLQNIAQLYEIWCLVQLDRFIRSLKKYDTGPALWESDEKNVIPFDRDDFDLDSDEWRIGTMKFEYKRVINGHTLFLDLLFQPTAGRTPNHSHWDGMMSLPEEQRPDLVLRLHRNDLPGKPKFTWIFDAKYRIATNEKNGNQSAPADAIYSMHRYRDAILWTADSKDEVEGRLTRESLGAFVLYPGKIEEDQKSRSKGQHQLDSADRVNIGAFPLRPNKMATHESHSAIADTALGKKIETLIRLKELDGDLPQRLREAQTHYDASPLVRQSVIDCSYRCAVRSHMDNDQYWKECRLYRLPIDEETRAFTPNPWGYIIPTGKDGKPYGRFPVIHSKIMKREEIAEIYRSKEIEFRDPDRTPDRLYRLFWLGEPEREVREVPLPSGTIVSIDSDPANTRES